jgi:SNF2 family DNA or RNA helicase
MSSILIHINEENSYYQLTGDVKELIDNRRVRFFLKDYLNADIYSEEQIIIPYQKNIEQDREKVLAQIRETLEKFDFEEKKTETVSEVLDDYFLEEKKFEEFSEKAKGIWNNELDKEEFEHFTKIIKEELPKRRLYDLQLLASYHLTFSHNACNFSVPGAGKTSIVYGAYAYLRNLPNDSKKYVNKLFIIGPLSSFGPWEDEYESCFGKKADSQRLAGGTSREDKVRHFLNPYSAEITLISYQGIASSIEDIIYYLRKHENKVMMVLDEAHKIKNVEGGVWAQAVLSLAKYCNARIVLTGTPVPNGYEDIYNLYNFIWPSKDIIKYHLFQLQEMSTNQYDKRIPQLIDNISPFFIRIKKKDLKLPDAIENDPIIVPMGTAQREIYEFIEHTYIDYFQEQNPSVDFKGSLIKARLIRLMQVATNPALLQKPIDEYYREQGVADELFVDDSEIIEKIMKYHEIETPPKFIVIMNLIKQLIDKGERVIVWGIFIQDIKELQEYLKINGIYTQLLIGETPIETDSSLKDLITREKIIREFHNPNSSFKVIIANPFAVAESISLHKACHNAIYMERNFNAGTFLQSKDRIHRYGLKLDDKINYYYILSENSIDGTIHNRLLEKEARMLEIIESQDIPLINMNMDYEEDIYNDIKAIIRDYVKRSSKD